MARQKTAVTARYKRALRVIERELRERRPPEPDLVCGCGAALDRPKVGRPPVRCPTCRDKHRRKCQRDWQQKKRQRQRETQYWSRVRTCKDPGCEEKR